MLATSFRYTMLSLGLAITFVLATFVPVHGSVSQHNPFYCFASDPIKPQSSMFATKVAYEAVRGKFNFNSFSSSSNQNF